MHTRASTCAVTDHGFCPAGFALCGFGMGEPAAARPGLMAAALQHLPADKPRVVVGLVSTKY
jgi:hypothetical protein